MPLDSDTPILSIRERAGISRVELAERLGVSRARITQLEAQGSHVRWDTIRRVAEACALHVELAGERPRAGLPVASCAVRADLIRQVADLVRISAVPVEYNETELIERERVVTIALRIKALADKLLPALKGPDNADG